jgi:hypothetical protein
MEQQGTTNMESQVTTRSTGIRYGLIAGVVSIAFFLILSVSGVNITTSPLRYLGWVITAVIIFLAHQYYKQNGNGFMSYGQGIGIAMWMGIISAVISSIFTYIYVKFIDTNFMDAIKDAQMQEMAAKGMSDEQIEQAMKIASMFMSPEAMLGFGLVFGFLGTLVIALIVTIFTQKKAPETAF